MNDETETVKPQNVSMYPRHWAIVRKFANDMGYPGDSAALRRIVDEWAMFKGAQLPLPNGQSQN